MTALHRAHRSVLGLGRAMRRNARRLPPRSLLLESLMTKTPFAASPVPCPAFSAHAGGMLGIAGSMGCSCKALIPVESRDERYCFCCPRPGSLPLRNASSSPRLFPAMW